MTAVQQTVDFFGSQEAAAKALGISQSYVSHLVNGIRTPSLRLCREIEKKTDGRVTIKDLLPEFFEKSK